MLETQYTTRPSANARIRRLAGAFGWISHPEPPAATSPGRVSVAGAAGPHAELVAEYTAAGGFAAGHQAVAGGARTWANWRRFRPPSPIRQRRPGWRRRGIRVTLAGGCLERSWQARRRCREGQGLGNRHDGDASDGGPAPQPGSGGRANGLRDTGRFEPAGRCNGWAGLIASYPSPGSTPAEFAGAGSPRRRMAQDADL